MKKQKNAVVKSCVGLTAILYIVYSLLPTGIVIINSFRKQWNKKIHRQKDGEKILYLTFDDGPHPRYTRKILRLLKKYKVKATFFTVGSFVRQYPGIIKKMKRQGHSIQLHSDRHRNYLFMCPMHTLKDMNYSKETLEHLGIQSTAFRPPWGCINLAVAWYRKKHALHLVMWDVMAEDWRAHTTKEEIAGKLLQRAQAGDVICIHDGRGRHDAPARTIGALRIVLPIWKKEGYTFGQI